MLIAAITLALTFLVRRLIRRERHDAASTPLPDALANHRDIKPKFGVESTT